MKQLLKKNTVDDIYSDIYSAQYPNVVKLDDSTLLYNFGQDLIDMLEFDSNDYLSIYTITSGTFTIRWNYSESNKRIGYKINNKNWINITATTTINLNAGDTVKLRGNKTRYSASSTSSTTNTFDYTGLFIVYGNIRSLDNEDPSEEGDPIYNDYKFRNLFRGNTGLLSIHDLKLPQRYSGTGTGSGTGIFDYMFSDCSKLQKIFDSIYIHGDNFRYMFSSCTALENVGNLDIYLSNYGVCKYMFAYSGVSILPSINYFYDEMQNSSKTYYAGSSAFEHMFYSCQNLKEIPSNFFEHFSSFGSYACEYMFASCTNLKNVAFPSYIDDCSDSVFAYMYSNCSSITSIPKDTFRSWLIINGNQTNLFYYTFKQCTSLKSVKSLPTFQRMTSRIFAHMFSYCTSLEYVVPIIGISAQADSLSYMFEYCSSLKAVNLFVASIDLRSLAEICIGCTSLQTIVCTAESEWNLMDGYFDQDFPKTNGTFWVTSNSIVPSVLEGWNFKIISQSPFGLSSTSCNLQDINEIPDSELEDYYWNQFYNFQNRYNGYWFYSPSEKSIWYCRYISPQDGLSRTIKLYNTADTYYSDPRCSFNVQTTPPQDENDYPHDTIQVTGLENVPIDLVYVWDIRQLLNLYIPY